MQKLYVPLSPVFRRRNGKTRLRGLIIGAALCAVAPLRAEAVPSYTLLDLGTLGGSVTTAVDGGPFINNQNVITGTSQLSNGDLRVFSFDANAQNPVLRDLGTLGGAESTGRGINDRGQIVGVSNLPSGTNRAFIVDTALPNTVLRGLGTSLPPDGSSQAMGINNLGQVVGESPVGPGQQRGFIIDGNDPNATMRVIPTFAGDSVAFSINDDGLVVGFSTDSNGNRRAFSFDSADQNAALVSLGTLGGLFSDARDVNGNGLIVGGSDTAAGIRHPFAFDSEATNPVMVDLGSLGGNGFALGVNNNGEIVGFSQAPFADHAFLFDSRDVNPQMLDLNDLIDPNDPLFGRVVLSFAISINDRGNIIANGVINDQSRLFFLRRQNTVSEPSAMGLLGIGLMGLLVARSFRQNRVID